MGEIIKTPHSDVTSDVYMEKHQGVTLTGGADETITFERTYDSTPAVLVTGDTDHTFSVDSKSTTQATITTGSSNDFNVDILVIGK